MSGMMFSKVPKYSKSGAQSADARDFSKKPVSLVQQQAMSGQLFPVASVMPEYPNSDP